MNDINIENADQYAVKHILNTFLKLSDFFPKNSNINLEKTISEDFNDEMRDKMISFVYETTKNLVNFHLNFITDKIEKRPEEGKNIVESFKNEQKFLNQLHLPGTTISNENFYHFNDKKIILDVSKFIETANFDKLKDSLLELFKKELKMFKNHTIFDVLIYQIDDNVDDTYFIKNLGLSYIEDKNFINNPNEINKKYIDNIFKSFNFLELDPKSNIITLNTVEDFFNDKYFKHNREEIIEYLNDKKGLFLSEPGNLKLYFDNVSLEKFSEMSSFDWKQFFNYAETKDLENVIDLILTTNSSKEDLEYLNNSETYDISVELSERNTILGKCFKHLYNIKNESNLDHILRTIDFIERKIDLHVENLKPTDVINVNKNIKNRELKLF